MKCTNESVYLPGNAQIAAAKSLDYLHVTTRDSTKRIVVTPALLTRHHGILRCFVHRIVFTGFLAKPRPR
eukprot:scaffold757_cov168-Amphora_coffeaeformis.AAC.1